MARLIDAKAGKKVFSAIAQPAEYKGVIHMVVPISEIDKLPTVDAVEVVHGRWIQDKQSKFEHRYNCSACNYRLIDEHCNYCPNCGAKMDGGVE